MSQNNMLGVLEQHPVIPVVTIYKEEEIDGIVTSLLEKGIKCIEVTLRTSFAMEAIAMIKVRYGDKIAVGVGTVVRVEQVVALQKIGVDFVVSPGLNITLCKALEKSGIAFIPGVATPSDIILALEHGWNVLKFFPANLFGGLAALKTYGQVFPDVRFCPTGGINETTYQDYLVLNNIVSVGGSWMMK